MYIQWSSRSEMYFGPKQFSVFINQQIWNLFFDGQEASVRIWSTSSGQISSPQVFPSYFFFFILFPHLVVSVPCVSLRTPVWLPAPPWCVSPVSHCLHHLLCRFVSAHLTFQRFLRVWSIARFFIPSWFVPLQICSPVLDWLPEYWTHFGFNSAFSEICDSVRSWLDYHQ